MRFSNGPVAAAMGLVAGLVALGVVSLSAQAETTVGVRVGTSGFEFDFLYSDYYHVDDVVVHGCTEWMSEPDLVVALHLARVSAVDLEIILGWRRRGLTWYDITHRCRQETTIYYVELPSDPGPPYGRAWGHWRNRPQQKLRLSDDEIRSFVTLKALADYSHRPVSEVLRLRQEGVSPARIAGKKTSRTEDAAPRGHQKSVGASGHSQAAKAEPSGPGKSSGQGKSSGKSKGKGHQ